VCAVGNRVATFAVSLRLEPMTAAPAQFRKQMLLPVADDPRWARVLARDKSADGHFWYSVSTTGVYCRPSCPSRAANPKNVQLHDSLSSAKATGFRPCRRCNPDGPSVEAGNSTLVAKACRIIETSEEQPSLEQLADAAGLSPGYFHRVFKAATGLTPRAMPPNSVPRRFVKVWFPAIPSPRRCTTPASIRAGGSKSRWACSA